MHLMTVCSNNLGLTISEKYLVEPSTKVVCLGVLINTEEGTVSIPPDKLRQISDTVRQWLNRAFCIKRSRALCSQVCAASMCIFEPNVGHSETES